MRHALWRMYHYIYDSAADGDTDMGGFGCNTSGKSWGRTGVREETVNAIAKLTEPYMRRGKIALR